MNPPGPLSGPGNPVQNFPLKSSPPSGSQVPMPAAPIGYRSWVVIRPPEPKPTTLVPGSVSLGGSSVCVTNQAPSTS